VNDDDPIKGELNEILSKLRSGDSDLERLKLRLYATRQAIQIRAIECAERRLTHEGEVLSYLQQDARPSSKTPVLPEASRVIYSKKSMPTMFESLREIKSKRKCKQTGILFKPLQDRRNKNAR